MYTVIETPIFLRYAAQIWGIEEREAFVRWAREGMGKRGGARTIVATHYRARWFFLLGFAKNERPNIDQDELKALQELRRSLLTADDRGIKPLIEQEKLIEVKNGNDQT